MPLQNLKRLVLAARHLCLVLQRIGRGGLRCWSTEAGSGVLDQQVTALNLIDTTLSACTLASAAGRALTVGEAPLAAGAGQPVLLRILALCGTPNTQCGWGCA